MFANQTTREFRKKGVFEANMFDIKQFDYRACQPCTQYFFIVQQQLFNYLTVRKLRKILKEKCPKMII